MTMLWRRTAITIIRNSIKQEIRFKYGHCAVNNLVDHNCLKPVDYRPTNILNITIRHKSNKQKDLDSDDEQEVFDEDDSTLTKDSKIVKFKTTTLRTDAILKSALGVSRNKIEQVFYESKIRVDGKKIMKKSHGVKLGNEIDVIKSVSPHNPDHLYVSRVEVLNLVPKEENISVTVRRFKNLLIENYEDDPYKGSIEQ
ncbi:mitochondrial transcription rescue factor 1 [Battus philenor]|uniref:mitochondrial transcription rescue factor 1 n=1 Tax=Battus philenor TaxID=42288 RepID=UPI0035D07701